MPLCLDWKSLFIWISFVLIFEAINASSPKCNEALDIGECNQNETKYYFNNETNECEEFVYGGCKGSENRFDSLSDCKTLCESKDQNSSAYRQWGSYPPIGRPREFDFKGSFEQTCLLPKVTGPCEGYFERYYFNPDTDSCEGFIYSGCRGNANNFQSYKDCCVTCHVLSSKPEGKSIDFIEPSSKFLDDSSVAKNGIVSSHSLKFERKSYGYLNHYWTSLVSQWRKTHSYIGYSVTNVHNIDWGNILEGSRATYTGHGQGLSRFYQIPKRFPHHITCLFPKEVGHCHNNLQRSFYNPITHRCESFMYHGCGGSPNNFLEPSLCQKICSKYIQVPIHHGPFPKILAHVNKGPIIHFPLYPNIHRRPFLHKLHIQPKPRIWHFKPTHPQIHPRLPGYHPHLHPKPKLVLRKPRLHQVKLHVPIRQRFIHTKPKIQGHNYYAYGHSYTKGEGSKTFTPSRNVIDVCHLPKKAGNCYNKLRRYYFDSYSGKCLKFIYTGCGGNQNNFKTLYMCKNHCKNRHYTVNIPLVKRKHLPSSRDVINVCRLSKETGHCYDKLWRYYYDSYSGKCIRFTYTGCGGNQNNFKTISECKSYCKNQYYKPNIHDTYFPVPEKVTPLPPSKDVNEVCRLSKEAGHCYNLLWRYYYDSYSGKCLRFTYTGCGGNRNNFKTLPECKSYCQKQYYKPNIPLVKPRPLPPLRDVIDVCRLSKETGHCYDKLWRYYYDSYSGKCLRFTYTGCGGNQNNFKTLPECKRYCEKQYYKPHNPLVHSQSLPPSRNVINVCGLPKEAGHCYNLLWRYHYDSYSGKCLKFSYTGCGGNQNNFKTVTDCKNYCEKQYYKPPTHLVKPKPLTHPSGVINVCGLPKESGHCYNKLMWRYYYDSYYGKCLKFTFSCGGNQNNFKTLHECENYCKVKHYMSDNTLVASNPFYVKAITGSQKPDYSSCHLPKKTGHCFRNIWRYYYDSTIGKCEKFIYTGCGGNLNNFERLQDCQKVCIAHVHDLPKVTPTPPEPNTNVCLLSKEKGHCFNNVWRYYFDKKTQKCQQFHYSGCGGNRNNFKIITDCKKRCEVEVTPTPPKQDINVCLLSKVRGNCHKSIWRYYFDKSTQKCRKFIYSGCGENGNNFKRIIDCKVRCEVTVKPTTPNPNINVCFLSKEQGRCYKRIWRYYFDKKTHRCEKFVYTGCGGNGNNFKRLIDCNKRCDVQQTQPPIVTPTPPKSDYNSCYLPKEKGRCSKSIWRYYYDSNIGKCKKFIYTGCGGNLNNFERLQDCENVCTDHIPKYKEVTPTPPKVEYSSCYLPKEKGHCYRSISRYYYNSKIRKCETFVYTGCGGNLNNFEALQDCENVCLNPVPDSNELEDKDTGKNSEGEKSMVELLPYLESLHKIYYGGNKGGQHKSQITIDWGIVLEGWRRQFLGEPQLTTYYLKVPKEISPETACKFEKTYGTCSQELKRYFYNSITSKCESFIYTGCAGNPNNFLSQSRCDRICAKSISQKTVLQSGKYIFPPIVEANDPQKQEKGSPLIKDKHGLINEPGHGLISVPEKGLNSGTEHVLISGPEHGLTSGAEHGLISGPEHELTSGIEHGLNKGTGHGLNKGTGHGLNKGTDHGHQAQSGHNNGNFRIPSPLVFDGLNNYGLEHIFLGDNIKNSQFLKKLVGRCLLEHGKKPLPHPYYSSGPIIKKKSGIIKAPLEDFKIGINHNKAQNRESKVQTKNVDLLKEQSNENEASKRQGTENEFGKSVNLDDEPDHLFPNERKQLVEEDSLGEVKESIAMSVNSSETTILPDIKEQSIGINHNKYQNGESKVQTKNVDLLKEQSSENEASKRQGTESEFDKRVNLDDEPDHLFPNEEKQLVEEDSLGEVKESIAMSVNTSETTILPDIKEKSMDKVSKSKINFTIENNDTDSSTPRTKENNNGNMSFNMEKNSIKDAEVNDDYTESMLPKDAFKIAELYDDDTETILPNDSFKDAEVDGDYTESMIPPDEEYPLAEGDGPVKDGKESMVPKDSFNNAKVDDNTEPMVPLDEEHPLVEEDGPVEDEPESMPSNDAFNDEEVDDKTESMVPKDSFNNAEVDDNTQPMLPLDEEHPLAEEDGPVEDEPESMPPNDAFNDKQVDDETESMVPKDSFNNAEVDDSTEPMVPLDEEHPLVKGDGPVEDDAESMPPNDSFNDEEVDDATESMLPNDSLNNAEVDDNTEPMVPLDEEHPLVKGDGPVEDDAESMPPNDSFNDEVDDDVTESMVPNDSFNNAEVDDHKESIVPLDERKSLGKEDDSVDNNREPMSPPDEEYPLAEEDYGRGEAFPNSLDEEKEIMSLSKDDISKSESFIMTNGPDRLPSEDEYEALNQGPQPNVQSDFSPDDNKEE